MVRKSASVCLILGLFFPGMVLALGLGELTVKSYLNEPLRAEIDLLKTAGLDTGQVKIRLATREDFARAGVDRAYFLTGLKFEVSLQEDQSGVLWVTSEEPVREPYLDFIVEARWPNGRLLREYTVLLDPPLFSGPGSGITASVKVTAPQAETSPREAAPRQAPPRPQRQYGAGAVEEPAAGSDYLVRRADTLWSIASSSRPAGTSVQQTMLDIQRLNPEAFIANNINQLKAGYVLRLPTSADISDTDFEQAVATVAEQDQNWQDNVTSIDSRRLDAAEGRDSSGVAGSDDEEGHLQIAGVEGAEDAARMAGDISARLEDLDRAQRDNEDLQARLNAMDQQLQMQQRLIELKDDQISALQQALTDTGEELGAGAEGTIEPIPDFGTEGVDTGTVDAEPEPEPEPAPPPPPEPTLIEMLMDYAIYIGAVLLLILLAVGWFLRDKINLRIPLGRGRKQRALAGATDEDDEFAGVELVSDDSLIVDEFTGEAEEETGTPEAITTFSSAADEEAYAAQFESGDALAEADIYIAYGRFPQAVDLLKTAISMEPINTEYRLKLMEASIEIVESGEYQQQYADLQVIGDEPALQRAKSMLEAVDGGELWLDDLPEASLTLEDVAAAQAAQASLEGPVDVAITEPELEVGQYDAGEETTAGDIDLDAGLALEEETEDASLELDLDDDSGLSLEDIEDSSAGLELELGDEGLGEQEDTGAVDLDLDLELESADTTAADADEVAPLEFDMGGDLEELEALSAEVDEEPAADAGGLELESLVDESEEDAAQQSMGDLELEDLAAEDAGEEEAPALEVAELEDDSDLDQFNMEDFQAEPAEDPAVEPAAVEPAAEEDALELPDLEMGDFEAEPEAAAEDAAADEEEGLLTDFGDLEIEAAAEQESAGEDEELVLDEGLEELAGSVDEVAGEAVEELELDAAAADDSFDLESLGESDEEQEAAAGAEAEDSEDTSGLMFATDGDEIATKLDLARAYMDMGDHDGARSILDEVLEDGSDDQKQEAQTLLDSID